MSDQARRHFPGNRLRYVFVERPRCPKCGAAELLTLRSRTDQDGSTTRRTRCRVCDHRFFVVVE